MLNGEGSVGGVRGGCVLAMTDASEHKRRECLNGSQPHCQARVSE